ncbi:MAG: transglutaminase domain-containing protein [Polyangiaceae bacterium]
MAASLSKRVFVRTLKAVWILFVITTPLLGVWGSSSLAVFLNGPLWLAIGSGLFLFPLGPLAWDAIANWRRGRRAEKKRRGREDKSLDDEVRPRFLTFGDRLILRTLFLNLLFMGTLLALFPQKGFEALATRGDWMLEGRKGKTVDRVRDHLFATAEGLSFLYEHFHDNPFRRSQDVDDDTDPKPPPAPSTDPGTDVPPPVGTDDGKKPAGDEKKPAADGARSRRWPLPATLHPAVRSIPKERETSIASVAKYLGEQEKDPFFLVKALHDYVADRVAYDAAGLEDKRKRGKPLPPQDPETVFRLGVSVCAGYAQLLEALGKAAGVKIKYVVGDSRSESWDTVRGAGHAWNAAEIEGAWYLIDATWNAGYVDGRTFTKKYKSSYLFTPAHVFLLTHFPDNAKWQLLAAPKTRGDFLRMPFLRPRFFSLGFKLLRPERSQVTVAGSAHLQLLNPGGFYLMANSVLNSTKTKKKACTVAGNGQERIDVRCKLQHEGRYDIELYSNKARHGSFNHIGSLGVNNDI